MPVLGYAIEYRNPSGRWIPRTLLPAGRAYDADQAFQALAQARGPYPLRLVLRRTDGERVLAEHHPGEDA